MEKELQKIENRLQSYPQNDIQKISLYQGIELYILTAKTDAVSMQQPKLMHILELNYCHSGQIEWKMENGNEIHLCSGDFSLHMPDAYAKSSLNFPTGEYEGLMLCIDLQELSAHPPESLLETGICVEMLSEKFCKNGTFTFFAKTEQTDAIFSAFYGQPKNLEFAYQKIKSIELLLYLSKIKLNQANQLIEYQSKQVEIIHAVHEYLMQNIGQKITIDTLSRQYLINPTTLKEVFKSVYGTSIATHIREHRMELAAQLLIETDLNLAEIAQQVGYESQSRFTSAFKTYFHTLPKEYRKKHQKWI